MESKILTILVVTLVLSLAGCIQSDIALMNDQVKIINQHLAQGNEYYNQSASATNRANYPQALLSCDNASREYNQTRLAAQEALLSAKNSEDQVFIDYMQLVLDEVDAKLNATSELRTAIILLQNNQDDMANIHLQLANEAMNRAQEFRKRRELIVEQNPTKFQ